MENKNNRIAKYKIIADSGGNRYCFFCEASGTVVCMTHPVRADTQKQELLLAWEDAKQHFNHCPKCGRFVCDTMFNADVCECVDCTPWEKRPKFCKKCGAQIPNGNIYCTDCGDRALYGEVWA